MHRSSSFLSLLGSSAFLLSVAGCATPSEETASGDQAVVADAPSSVMTLPVLGDRTCPPVVNVGVLGDSFIGGIKLTFDIKSYVARDATLALARTNEGENIRLVYRAPLGEDIRTCVGETETTSMFNDTSTYVVRFADGHVSVEVVISPSLELSLTSTWANQAIFEVGESL